MSTQYRMLEPGEVIQEGDERQILGGTKWAPKWVPCVKSIGNSIDLWPGVRFRRPIKATNESSISQSEITVEQAMKDLLRASENQDESIDNGPSVIRKFLSIGAEFENWPECYQKLAWEISRIQSDRESLKSELARLQSGGCARDQRTTQWCAEAMELAKDKARLIGALKAISENILAGGQAIAAAQTLLAEIEKGKKDE